jgi:hypothetical protein
MQILFIALNCIGSIIVGVVIAFALPLFESLLQISAFSIGSGCLTALLILMLVLVPHLVSADKWRRKNWGTAVRWCCRDFYDRFFVVDQH